MAYCTERDLYDHGIPRGAVPEPARLLPEDGVDTAANTLRLDGHGFTLDDVVMVRPEAGGSLPAPLVATAKYYARPVDPWRFELAAAPGGPAIDLTTTGSRVLVYTEPPVQAAIAWATARIDGMLPAHVVPLVEPYPDEVVITAAELAAWKYAQRAGGTSVALTAIFDDAKKRIERWAKHVPIRGTNAPPQASLAVAASSSGSANPWRRYGGL